jgi:hypothetical protein
MFDTHGQNCSVTKFRVAGSLSPEKVKKVLLIAKASSMSLGPTQPSVQAVKGFCFTEGKNRATEAVSL